ncbi:MAG: regulatory protein RecX [bacterium]
MKLEKLFPSEHIADRWLAVLEGGETLRVDTGAVAALGLRAGMELEEEPLSALREAAADYAAKERALAVLARRQMSRKELLQKLREKGAAPESAEKAADLMERVGAVNEREYAGAVVRMCARKGFGKSRVLQELMKRGVPRETWEEALLELPEENGETLDALLAKRLPPEPTEQELRKAAAWLQRRGYGWSEIKSALRRRAEYTEE